MFLNSEEYLSVFGPLEDLTPPPKGASTWQQIARGLSSGVSFGLDKPLGLRTYEEAGAGGWPESAAWLTGMGAGFVPLTRAACLGVAGAGMALPKLLGAGVRPGAAAATMLKPGFRVLPKALSDAGRLAGVKWRGPAGAIGEKAVDALSPSPGIIGPTETLIPKSSSVAKEALETLRLEMSDVTSQIAKAPNKNIKRDWILYKRTLQRSIDYLERKAELHPPIGPAPEEAGIAALRAISGKGPAVAEDFDALSQLGQSKALAEKMPLPFGAGESALQQAGGVLEQSGISRASGMSGNA